jgi:hypothetical protein
MGCEYWSGGNGSVGSISLEPRRSKPCTTRDLQCSALQTAGQETLVEPKPAAFKG